MSRLVSGPAAEPQHGGRETGPETGPVLAIDIGGTKIAAAVVGRDGRILRRATVPTPVSRDSEVVAEGLRRAVAEVRQGGGGLAGVGIGSAGPLDVRQGTVSPVNIPAWRPYRIIDDVQSMVPAVPVALAGDGHCMALGEYWHGAGAAGALLGMVVSTGVGGGVVLDGRVQTGTTGSAGHIGHITLDANGPLCPCGGRGCVEVYASGPAMVAWALDQGWSPVSAPADGVTLAAAARAGDPVARAAFDRGAEALAASIVCAAALVELDEVVLGGGVVNGAADLLIDQIRAGVGRIAGMDFIRRVQIRAGRLGADAGLLGAAALAFSATSAQYAHSTT